MHEYILKILYFLCGCSKNLIQMQSLINTLVLFKTFCPLYHDAEKKYLDTYYSKKSKVFLLKHKKIMLYIKNVMYVSYVNLHVIKHLGFI